uniref:WAP four-disulfide core domain protein 2 n=1 Tax=Bos mutus grunniens TaxID=30521 RepID=A0A8C0AES4_BOSMU
DSEFRSGVGIEIGGHRTGGGHPLRAGPGSPRPVHLPGSIAVKPGECPELEGDANCTKACVLDEDCDDNLKCCQAGCATVCQMPNDKPGSCPNVDIAFPQLGLCRDQCQVDSQCPDALKCCINGCGRVSCVTPVF